MNIKRFSPKAPLPMRKTDGAIGYDLPAGAEYSTQYRDRWYTPMGDVLTPNDEGTILIPLCWGFEIPPGHVGLLDPRSSTSHWLLSGRIDPDYRGQMFAKTTCELLSRARPSVKLFDRIAQLIIVPVLTPVLTVVDELSQTARGTGGHGSTGR